MLNVNFRGSYVMNGQKYNIETTEDQKFHEGLVSKLKTLAKDHDQKELTGLTRTPAGNAPKYEFDLQLPPEKGTSAPVKLHFKIIDCSDRAEFTVSRPDKDETYSFNTKDSYITSESPFTAILTILSHEATKKVQSLSNLLRFNQ